MEAGHSRREPSPQITGTLGMTCINRGSEQVASPDIMLRIMLPCQISDSTLADERTSDPAFYTGKRRIVARYNRIRTYRVKSGTVHADVQYRDAMRRFTMTNARPDSFESANDGSRIWQGKVLKHTMVRNRTSSNPRNTPFPPEFGWIWYLQ